MKADTHKLNETEIIQLLRQREKSGLSALYEQYSGMVFGLICRIIRAEDIAESVMQDSFLKVWKKIDSYDPDKGRFLTWVLNIARNTAIDMLRSRNYRDTANLTGLEQHSLPRDRAYTETRIDGIGVRETVARLEPKYRRIIELIYFGGYTQVEVAEELEIPLGTVKSRVKKAFQNLRVMLS